MEATIGTGANTDVFKTIEKSLEQEKLERK